MSSDSDEDELLQMALKEQAQRHVAYETPQPRKPVASYLQQPKSAATQQKGGRSQAKKYEEEEESEVEMLSISSGDEEVSRDRGSVAKNRARGRRDDDGLWDGDEPNCWKRVDETEVLLYLLFNQLSYFIFIILVILIFFFDHEFEKLVYIWNSWNYFQIMNQMLP